MCYGRGQSSYVNKSFGQVVDEEIAKLRADGVTVCVCGKGVEEGEGTVFRVVRHGVWVVCAEDNY